jgi:hypothetical protein
MYNMYHAVQAEDYDICGCTGFINEGGVVNDVEATGLGPKQGKRVCDGSLAPLFAFLLPYCTR